MLRAEADKKAGTGRLLLLCMPFRSAAHTAIGLFVFAFDAPKFFGALDAGSTSRASVRKVGCRQRRPKNSIQKILPIWFDSSPILLGSAAGAAALKSGRRPRGRSPWHCRRPSVVTEGYIRLPPLPPTHLVSIRVHPRSTIIPLIYSVFCVWCSKHIVFYRVLWPSPSPGFILATLKNHGFFMVLGLRKGSGTDNWPS